jgi:hypothetical protein
MQLIFFLCFNEELHRGDKISDDTKEDLRIASKPMSDPWSGLLWRFSLFDERSMGIYSSLE